MSFTAAPSTCDREKDETMPTNVVMPQMGESIAEGTIVRWIKQVGDHLELDEPLFEISTDKVDAEIPAPASGILLAIQVEAGETVPVDSVVAVIGEASDVAAASTVAAALADQPATHADEPVPPAGHAAQAAPSPAARRAGEAVAAAAPEDSTAEDHRHRRRKSSPLVRRIATERGVDLGRVPGTGLGGRITKQDILAFIERGGAATGAPSVRESGRPMHADTPVVGQGVADTSGRVSRDRVEIVPMTPMRRLIAEHMVLSRRTSAHVHSVFDVDFSQVAALRAAKQDEYQKAGTKLTYLSFIARAVIEALGAVPVINASIDGDTVVYHKDINLGIAVALDNGLIVPVIERADEKNLLGLSRAIADVAERARTKRLRPEEVHGGTFTITNPGSFGAIFGMPIINQPQVAILGVGALEKRPVVITDALAIRLRAYLTLGYDHRLIDGAVADQFMARIKHTLENFDAAGL